MLKRGFFIELDDIPKSDEDMCISIAKYCGDNNLNFEFVKRTSPIISMIDGHKYEIIKKLLPGKFINCWVLSCKEID